MSSDDFNGVEVFDWEGAEDLTALSEAGLRAELARVSQEERLASYRLEVLKGRAALIRAELATRSVHGRGLVSLDDEELARALLGEGGAVS